MQDITDYLDELARLRRLIADAARVVREKGYCELELDALVDEWYRADYADLGEYLKDDERHGLATGTKPRGDKWSSCGNCHQSWPCGCGDPAWTCDICAGDQFECECDERSYIENRRPSAACPNCDGWLEAGVCAECGLFDSTVVFNDEHYVPS
jgi:hypothetical protein